MADQKRSQDADLDALRWLQQAAQGSSFFRLMRRFDALYRDRPATGRASAAEVEPLRLSQEVTMAFAPTAVASLSLGDTHSPRHRVAVSFFGVFGPNGALPLVFTEYALRAAARTRRITEGRKPEPFVDFVNIFHHRALSLLYRAWASSRPEVSHDRPDQDRFAFYLASLLGCAEDRERSDDIAHALKLYFAGRFVHQCRNAEGLEALATDLLGVKVEVEPMTGEWLDIPEEFAWKLGERGLHGCIGDLGEGSVLGPQYHDRQHKFDLVIGPVGRPLLQSLLDGPARRRLQALVRSYIGEEFDCDLRLLLEPGTIAPITLGEPMGLGETTYLIVDESDLVPPHKINLFTS